MQLDDLSSHREEAVTTVKWKLALRDPNIKGLFKTAMKAVSCATLPKLLKTQIENRLKAMFAIMPKEESLQFVFEESGRPYHRTYATLIEFTTKDNTELNITIRYLAIPSGGGLQA